MSNKISNVEYRRASNALKCEPAVIKAVAVVESNGNGFEVNGRLKILFEPYIFYKSLKKAGFDVTKLMKGNEDIIKNAWDAKMYGAYSIQWDKLKKASLIDERIAMESCSWGLFQIMGFNFKAAGYLDVYGLQHGFSLGEIEQLNGFTNYIISSQLDDELQVKDFTSFARQYNGPLYWKNDYDAKMLEQYKLFKKEIF